MPRPMHFEVHAEQPDRAIAFYEKVLSWKFTPWGPPGEYWLIVTGEDGSGINGGLLPRRGNAPEEDQAVNAYPCTVDVTSVDETLAAVERCGGQVALPKMAVPGVGWLAYFKDTEGNIFGAMQADTSAR